MFFLSLVSVLSFSAQGNHILVKKKKKDIVCFLSLVFQNLCYILDPECPKNICVKVLIICIVLPKCGAQMGLSVIMCMSLQGIVGLWFLHSLSFLLISQLTHITSFYIHFQESTAISPHDQKPLGYSAKQNVAISNIYYSYRNMADISFYVSIVG